MSLITSKDTIQANGYDIGNVPNKDMYNENYTYEFDPNVYQSEFFSGMANFIDANIVQGDKASEDRLIASAWYDLDDDIFDNWGYFYLYDVNSGKYYFPLLSPQNQDDGIFTTQTFNAFGRTFTIQHGWAVQGIFKFDISVNDNLPFRFGAYGNMGFDEHGEITRFKHPVVHSVSNTNMNLYYLKSRDLYNDLEVLYSYFVPKVHTQNTSRTYIDCSGGTSEEDITNNNIMSVNVQSGLLVYFSKSYDVRDWIISDLNNVTDPSPSTASIIDDEDPISNICFPAGTPIKTDQGLIPIEQINSNIHTIRDNKIVTITKTITQDKYLVCIEKDALAKNIPCEKTLISKNHKLFYNKKMIKSKELLNLNNEKIYRVKYDGDVLYNVLLENQDKMIVNNLICETLDPKNGIAQMYLYLKKHNFTKSEEIRFINNYNNYVVKNKIFASKK